MLGAAGAWAQTLFPAQQAEILKNNPTLRAATTQTEAAAADNLTGLTLGSPEVSFSYLFGVNKDIPNKINVEVTQPLDVPTLSGARRRAAEAENAVGKTAVATSRAGLALQVEEALDEYVYQSKLIGELERQQTFLAELTAMADSALKRGALTLIEYDKIELEKLSVENDLATARADREAAQLTLTALNGQPLSSLPTEWPATPLPADFEAWVAQAAAANPELATLSAQMASDQAQIELRRKEQLPEFSVGYGNELVRGGNMHGFLVGFNLPLWGGKSRVKAAEATRAATQMQLASAEEQFRALKRAQYDKARLLQASVERYAKFYERLQTVNKAHLDNAFKRGTMTVFEYVTEQEDFFEHALTYLTALRDYHSARTALYDTTL